MYGNNNNNDAIGGFTQLYVDPRNAAYGVQEPKINISKPTKEGIITLEVIVPGFVGEELSVTYNEGSLTIRGEHHSNKNGSDSKTEHKHENFSRSLALDPSIEESGITSSLKNGVLTIHLQKTENYTKGSNIKINE